MPLSSDHPPIGAADSLSGSADEFAHLSTDLGPNGKLLDILANDTDPDLGDAAHFFLLDWSQPVDQLGNPIGTLSIAATPDGRQALAFFSDDANLQVGDHTITFFYRVADQWANAGDPATWPFSVSQQTQVTIHVTGNSVPGETLSGGNHANVLTGAAGNDNICGGNASDTLTGAGGADTLTGENGKDLLAGGDGNDRLFGDKGDDTLDGGKGDDTLTGGEGADRLVFGYAFGHDVVTDFDPHSDRIYVDHNMWGSYQDLLAHAAQGPGEVVTITSDFDGYTLTLWGVELEDLKEKQFLFT